MRRLYTYLMMALLSTAGPALGADEAARVIHLTADQIGAEAFSRPETVVSELDSDRGSYTARDFEAFRSQDGHFDMGIYRTEGEHFYQASGPYGIDEFMYFLEGSVRVTAADGTVTEVGPGEALLIPKEWEGSWYSPGYTKIYVIYSPDAPIE